MSIGDPPPTPRAAIGGMGWECPRCHATYAPWVATCTECKSAARSLRERIAEAQPPAPLFPAVPYVPPPVYPLFPAPQWPYGQVVWCETTAIAPLTPPALAAGGSYTYTVTLGGMDAEPSPDDGDDGTAGVPARI